MSGYEPTPITYVFAPSELFKGAAMDSADKYDYRAIHVSWRGGDTWAITRGTGASPTSVWCEASSDWEYEPSPSNREDDFLARTRYPLDEALTIGARLSGEPQQ